MSVNLRCLAESPITVLAICGQVIYYTALGAMSGCIIYNCAILFRVVSFIPVQYGLFLVKFKLGWLFRDQGMLLFYCLHQVDISSNKQGGAPIFDAVPGYCLLFPYMSYFWQHHLLQGNMSCFCNLSA